MYVKILDRQGNEIGCIEKKYLVPLSLRHQIVRVVLYAKNKGTVLMQQRSLTDDSCPGMWDTSSSGNVDGHEAIEHAAVRELKEELGIEAEERALAYVGSYGTSEGLTGGRLERETHLYCLSFGEEFNNFIVDPHEVGQTQWRTPKAWLASSKHDAGIRLTNGAAQALNLFVDWLRAK